MSGCLATQELVDFVEGRVDPPARERVEDHASRCDSCREVLSSLARTTPPAGPRAIHAEHAERVLAPGTVVGRYLISHQVGAGGLGLVYAARDPELDRVVAIKLLRSDSDPRMQVRLRREAIAMAQLTHPNVVAVHDVGAFDDQTFIAMEYVPGETLARWLTTPRSPREILDAFCAAGRGLAAAHAAGVVHRDFKPENVLIGRGGQIRVGDFGLARTTGADDGPDRAAAPSTAETVPEPVPAPPNMSPVRTHLTAPGTLLGTPYYLAPEIFRGADADARSDQFSFCVALFAALHRERPSRDDAEDIAATTGLRRLRGPRMAPRIPRRIRMALARGLAADPAERFASLDSLLAELAPPPRRRARWALGLGVALAAVAVLLGRALIAPVDQRCTGAAAAFSTAWNPERRAAIAAAFAATRLPYADDARNGVNAALDGYAARWTQAHTEACRATRILGEQTESMLELRMTCLARRHQTAAALVGALATGDAATVRSAVGAVLGLPDAAGCADLAALRQVVPPPSDPVVRGRITALTERLAEARAKYETAAYARAFELIRPIATEARALGYRPFDAEVALQQGKIEHDLGDIAAAEASVQSAIWSAEAGRHDEIAARAWTFLIFIVGYERADIARGESFVPRATAALARLGDNPAFESDLEDSLNALALRKGDPRAAIGHVERAVALAERAYGPDHLEVGKANANRGVALLGLGEIERSVLSMQRALQIFERVLGPNHPTVAIVLVNLGSAHAQRWDYAAAEPTLRRALAIREAALAPDHRDLPIALASLSRVLRAQNKLDEALVLDRRAVAIVERTAGPDDILLLAPLLEIGLVEAQLGAFAEADGHLARAIAIAGKLLGNDHYDAMLPVAALGDSLLLQSRWADAARRYEQAIAVFEREPGARNDLASAEANLARARIELHEPARALAPLERLAADLDHRPPQLRPMIELTLARALWDSGGDRERACQLGKQALARGKQTAGVRRDDVAQIERWLASHRDC